jgi:hypothetical protein
MEESMRPTVADLEALLNSEDDTPVTIHPDGSVTPVGSQPPHAGCDCGATTSGRWGGIHQPTCALVKRELICHGDGGECERLMGLKAGHALTESDVDDISNLAASYSDEITSSSEVYYRAYRDTLEAVAPDKADLVAKINSLQSDLVVQRTMANVFRQQVHDIAKNGTRNTAAWNEVLELTENEI